VPILQRFRARREFSAVIRIAVIKDRNFAGMSFAGAKPRIESIDSGLYGFAAHTTRRKRDAGDRCRATVRQ
jgi:hypothetical protein